MSDDAEAEPLPLLSERIDPQLLPPPALFDAETARRIEMETIRALDLALKRFALNLRAEVRQEVAEVLRREYRIAHPEGQRTRN